MWLDRDEILILTLFLVLSFLASFIGNRATQSSVNDWFTTLNRPPYNPPRWLIPITWTLIYIMIGISGYLVWRQRTDTSIRLIMTVYGVQLILNALWPVLFFGLQQIGWAFVEICLLWGSVVLYVVLTWPVSRAGAGLFVPYALWLTYAGYLNLMYWYLNSP